MRRFPVTINPHMPATHTGLVDELPRRRRRPVRPVITAGQAAAYAGAAGAAGLTEPEPTPEPGATPTSAPGSDCCG